MSNIGRIFKKLFRRLGILFRALGIIKETGQYKYEKLKELMIKKERLYVSSGGLLIYEAVDSHNEYWAIVTGVADVPMEVKQVLKVHKDETVVDFFILFKRIDAL